MSILDEIIVYKKKEVSSCKEIIPVNILECEDYFTRETISLSQSITDKSKTGIIAEFKKKSPSKGIINQKAHVEIVTQGYASAGASGLSVLTDFNYFGGSVDDLRKARAVNSIPILRKEFIVDEYQIVEARAHGADAVLLIAAALKKNETKALADFARSLDMEVLLEVHSENELDHLNDYVNIVGVNNRNLKTFDVDLKRSIILSEKIPNQFVKISESGIKSADDIKLLKEYGFRGFLIGESFMKETQPHIAFMEFVNTLNR